MAPPRRPAAGRPLLSGAVTVPCPVPSATRRLFLFHHAGGSHLLYRGWESDFPPDWELCLLDAPGRGRLLGEPLIATSAGLVDFFLKELEQWTDRPFAFFGHSMGALIAYELTCRLVAEERPAPLWAGLSSCGAPRAPRAGSGPRRHEFTDVKLREWLRAAGGTPDAVLDQPGMWRAFGPVFRNDFALVDTWRPALPALRLPVALSAFGGADDAVVGHDRLLAWDRYSRRFHGPHMYRGGHFYLRDHHRSVITRIVEAVSAAIPTPAGPSLAGTSGPTDRTDRKTGNTP
ncbi:thioesterase II family protein [Streptomyces tremellae]|uniref:thioesterase II family protein n=1 Tax=Streptomyces tremellae TaxID=1124239 RepID=UPI0031E9154F